MAVKDTSILCTHGRCPIESLEEGLEEEGGVSRREKGRQCWLEVSFFFTLTNSGHCL